MEQSLTQFLGRIVDEAEHYRCDFFILMESICNRMPNPDKDARVEMLIASRECGCEWIYPELCDGESYSWHSMLYHDNYNYIYKCDIRWDNTPFGYERVIEHTKITREEMVEWMEHKKSTNETCIEVKEIMGI